METLNEDLQSSICFHLSLKDVLNFRQVSRWFHELIATNKQLWVKILERDVLSQQMLLHPSRTQFELATAAHIESWVKAALRLRIVYTTKPRAEVQRIAMVNSLRVTWAKLIRARWCLVAAATELESRLSIWELSDSWMLRKEYFLEGPVMDGHLEDDGDLVIAALTVGTTSPSVHILSLGTIVGEVKIATLKILPRCSFVRYLRDSLVICAVKDGDDTYPYLINWMTNSSWTMVPRSYINNVELPWGKLHSTLRAATEWQGFIVAIMDRSVEVFQKSKFEGVGGSIAAIGSVAFTLLLFDHRETNDLETVEQAAFDDVSHLPPSDLLHFSCRTKKGCFFMRSLRRTGETSFALVTGNYGARIASLPMSSAKFVVGSSFGYQIHLEGAGVGRWEVPFLKIVRLEKTSVTGTMGLHCITARTPKFIDRHGFPLMHYTTTFDFDDAAGLLLIGTSRGELCLARFLPSSVWAPGALADELPDICHLTNQIMMHQHRLKMDIPEFYLHRKIIREGRLPESVFDETICSWTGGPDHSPDNILHLGERWSNDWSKFKHLVNWIAPSSRWALNDLEYGLVDTTVSIIRPTLGIRGDLIPLAFRNSGDTGDEDQHAVVFRVGPRLYLSKVSIETFDTIANGQYGVQSKHYVHSLGALPIHYSPNHPLTERMLEDYCSDRDVWDNLTEARYGDTGERELRLVAADCQEILDFLANNPDKLLNERAEVGENPEAWSRDDWSLLEDGFLCYEDS